MVACSMYTSIFIPSLRLYSYRMRDWSVIHRRLSWLGDLCADARSHCGDLFQYSHGPRPGPVAAQQSKCPCIFV